MSIFYTQNNSQYDSINYSNIEERPLERSQFKEKFDYYYKGLLEQQIQLDQQQRENKEFYQVAKVKQSESVKDRNILDQSEKRVNKYYLPNLKKNSVTSRISNVQTEASEINQGRPRQNNYSEHSVLSQSVLKTKGSIQLSQILLSQKKNEIKEVIDSSKESFYKNSQNILKRKRQNLEDQSLNKSVVQNDSVLPKKIFQQEIPQVKVNEKSAKYRSVSEQKETNKLKENFNYMLPLLGLATRNKKPKATKESKCYELVKFYMEKISKVLQGAQSHNLDQVIENLMKVIEVCVQNEELIVFLEILILIGKLAFDIGQYDKSVFFLNQGLIYIDLTRKFEFKATILIELSRLCRHYKDFYGAVKMLKKALQYSWEQENFDQEIQIYDQLGLAYYYLGEIELSIFYHNKFATGDIERLDSPNRMMSQSDLVIARRKLVYNFEKFNKIIFFQLQLPLKNFEHLFYDFDSIEEQMKKSENLVTNKAQLRKILETSQRQLEIEKQQQDENLQQQIEFKKQAILQKQRESFVSNSSGAAQNSSQNNNDKSFTSSTKPVEFDKSQTYKYARGNKILEEILDKYEFQFEISKPIFSKVTTEIKEIKQRLKESKKMPYELQLEKIKKTTIPTPQLIQIKIKYAKKNEKINFQNLKLKLRNAHLKNDDTIFSPNDNENEQKFKLHQFYQKINRQAAENIAKLHKCNDIIHINHWNKEKISKQETKIRDPQYIRKWVFEEIKTQIQNFLKRNNLPEIDLQIFQFV